MSHPSRPERGDTVVLVVRHGDAGSKDHWSGDDRARPLSPRGRVEAEALVGVLARFDPGRIVSSAYLRCRQTVEPLARHLGLPIEASPALEPDAAADAVALLRDIARRRESAVVCTHGETIHVLQQGLADDPAVDPIGQESPEKGSVWVLRAREGQFIAADYVPPAPPGDVGPSASYDRRR